MTRSSRPALALCLILAVGLLGTPAAALANMANPWQPGDPLGEPTGALRAIAIEREDLAIDLRPLAAGEPARVTATYRVRNDGTAQQLSLLFIAAALAEEVSGSPTVWLDGVTVPSQSAAPAVLPKTWQPPERTPALDGGEGLRYQVEERDNRALEFSIALPSGQHDIRVSYLARATAYSGDSPVRYWQLGYVLAPARDWASFGDLDVRVELPPGWSAASEPSLSREGDVLTGAFDGVPADAMALTAQAPVPFLIDLLPVAWLGGLLICVTVGVLAGRWLGRRRRRSAWALVPGFLLGCAWMAGVIVAATTTYLGVVSEGQRAWTYGYGQTMLGLLSSPFALAGGLIFTQLAAALANRAVRPREPNPTRLRPAG